MSAARTTAAAPPPVRFRFDAERHEYIELGTGVVLPHITGMLDAAGWVDDTWYTEESCERGHQVHRLTADYDLGALNVETCVTNYRGYLLGHVAAMGIIPHTWDGIEEPLVHSTHRYGGRLDRRGVMYTHQALAEIKSGLPARSHAIQTALQAILVAPLMGLPPELVQRFVLYLTPKGKFKLEQHVNPADYREAQRIIRVHAG